VREQELAKQEGAEESKESFTEVERTKLLNKINTIVESLTEVKKAAPKAGFRSFMATAKNDLKEMQMETPADGSSAAPVFVGEGMNNFAATAALPKNQPLFV